MSWLRASKIRHYFANSIWIMPVLSIKHVPSRWFRCFTISISRSETGDPGINPEAVRTVLGTMASSMFTFVVFVSSAVLIAVQLASPNLPRGSSPSCSGIPVTKFA